MFRQPVRGFRFKRSPFKTQKRNESSFGLSSPSSVGFGLFLVSLGIPILVVNERRAVKQDQLREKGKALCKELDVDDEKTANNLSEFDHALVHAVGHVGTGGLILSDPEYNVKKVDAPAPLRLKRVTLMYQWQETRNESKSKDEKGNETTTVTYSYAKVWSGYQQNFEGPNPPAASIPFPPTIPGGVKVINAPVFYIGKQKYRLAEELSNQIEDYILLPLEGNCQYKGDELKMLASSLYSKNGNPDSPQIGDISVKYLFVPEGTHTTISKFTKRRKEFVPFEATLQKKLSEEGEIKAHPDTAQISGTGEPLIIPDWIISLAEGFVLSVAPLHLNWIKRGNFDLHDSFEGIRREDEDNANLLRALGSIAVVVGTVAAAQVIPFFAAARNGAALTLGIGIAYQTIQDAKRASRSSGSASKGDITLE